METQFLKTSVIIILLLSVISLFAIDVELTTNSGFESGTSPWKGRNCTLTQSGAYAHTGTYSGQATGRSSSWMGIKQSLLGKIMNGATYTVSGWVRISTPGDSIKMSVEQADENGTQYFGIAEGIGSNTQWVQLSGTFTVNIAGTVNTFDLYFEGPAAGVDIYVDDVSFYGPEISTDATGSVFLGTRYQIMEGFGAAGGWYEGNFVNHPQASTLTDLLFKQLGLDIYRFRNTYEIDSGYLDRTARIIKSAKAVRPELKLKVAAWSPPARLKSNGNTREGTLARSNGEYMYAEYARWWADSLADFSSRGISPDYVSIQNEPDYTNSGWDTCVWAPTETAELAGFAEGFRAVYELVGSGYKFIPPDGANFQNAGSFIDAFTATDKEHIFGYAYHLYAGLSEIRAFATTYNDKPHIMSEYSHRNEFSQSTFTDAMDLALTMDTALVQGEVSAYIFWELFWGNPGGLISVESSTYKINPVYYVFKQFSAFVHAGWQRVAATSDSLNLNLEAYLSPDGSQLVMIVINASTTKMTLSLSALGGFTATGGTLYRTSETENCLDIGAFSSGSAVNIPARSVTTIAMTGKAGEPVSTPVPTPSPIPTPTPTPSPTPTPAPTKVPLDCNGVSGWDANAIYATAGTLVRYNDNLYQNNWYSQGQNPQAFSGEYEVWTLLGACGITGTPGPTTPPTGIKGDVNDDGRITILDALMIAQYYVGLQPTGFHEAVADVNCSGTIDILDALMVAQYYVSLINSLAC